MSGRVRSFFFLEYCISDKNDSSSKSNSVECQTHCGYQVDFRIKTKFHECARMNHEKPSYILIYDTIYYPEAVTDFSSTSNSTQIQTPWLCLGSVSIFCQSDNCNNNKNMIEVLQTISSNYFIWTTFEKCAESQP